MHDPLIGSVLGKYRIHSWIGSGGYGTVYLAHHIQQGYPAALKVLDPTLARDPRHVGRFLQEYRVLYELVCRLYQHPHIVRTYDYGQDRGYYYIAVEYMDGGNLEEWLGRGVRIEPRQAIQVITQVALALDVAHAIHIVHRDVKPSNVLFDRRGRVALADFGIAKNLAELQRSTGRTPPGTCLGTPAYMPPEQVRGGGNVVGPWSDIYSLGVMSYQVLCGRLPFERDNDLGVLYAHVHEMPPPPRLSNPGLSAESEGVLLWALNKSPDDRPPSAGAFANSLAAALQLSPAQTKQPVVLPSDVRRRLPTGVPRQQMPRISPPGGSVAGAQRAWALVWVPLLAVAVLLAVLLAIPKPGPGFVPYDPTPTALLGTLAFVTHAGGDTDIALLQSSQVHHLPLSGSNESRPAWSPDGRRLAFVTDRNGNYDIYTMNAGGGELAQLTRDPGWDSGPSWSPDGRQIAFDSNSTGNFDIYLMDADGSNTRRLTSSAYLEGDPAFSPDGKTIAYVSDRDGNYEIYLMDTQGRTLHRLTTEPGRDSQPAWSPDGRQIVYECESSGRLGICIVNVDGSGRTQLVRDAVDCRHPTWSPDGRSIAYTREGSSGWQLYMIDIDGSDQRLVPGTGRDSTDPAWKP